MKSLDSRVGALVAMSDLIPAIDAMFTELRGEWREELNALEGDRFVHSDAPSHAQERRLGCEWCGGTGKIAPSMGDSRCPNCGGVGFLPIVAGSERDGAPLKPSPPKTREAEVTEAMRRAGWDEFCAHDWGTGGEKVEAMYRAMRKLEPKE